MNPSQCISGNSLRTDYVFEFHSASGVDWYHLRTDPKVRVYVDSLGNVRNANGGYICNPAVYPQCTRSPSA